MIGFMKLRLIVEQDPETGRYSSVFPELPGCASAGDTEEEAIANAREALDLWFEPTDIPVGASAKLIEVTA
jgi:predicted RNase H-like HicB family nuclease